MHVNFSCLDVARFTYKRDVSPCFGYRVPLS